MPAHDWTRVKPGIYYRIGPDALGAAAQGWEASLE
jgi:hypothetical protein